MPIRPLQLRAQSMRRAQTPAERKAWQILRQPPFAQHHFRRQVPFSTRYIADFASHSLRLIIEIDGPTHDLESPAERQRTDWLTAQGYRIIRFTNAQVAEWQCVERTLSDLIAAH